MYRSIIILVSPREHAHELFQENTIQLIHPRYSYSGGGGYSHIPAIEECAAEKCIVFK